MPQTLHPTTSEHIGRNFRSLYVTEDKVRVKSDRMPGTNLGDFRLSEGGKISGHGRCKADVGEVGRQLRVSSNDL